MKRLKQHAARYNNEETKTTCSTVQQWRDWNNMQHGTTMKRLKQHAARYKNEETETTCSTVQQWRLFIRNLNKNMRGQSPWFDRDSNSWLVGNIATSFSELGKKGLMNNPIDLTLFNLKCRLLYLKTQSVPRCKQFSSRL